MLDLCKLPFFVDLSMRQEFGGGYICFGQCMLCMLYVSSYTTCLCYTDPLLNLLRMLSHMMPHNNFRCPVIWLTTLLGAGPIPRTVAEPEAICVLPASLTTFATSPKLMACACSVNSSSSESTFKAILAWPRYSQRLRTSGAWRLTAL